MSMAKTMETINNGIRFYNKQHPKNALPLLREVPEIIQQSKQASENSDIDSLVYRLSNGDVWSITLFTAHDWGLWDVWIDSIQDYQGEYGKERTKEVFGINV